MSQWHEVGIPEPKPLFWGYYLAGSRGHSKEEPGLAILRSRHGGPAGAGDSASY